MQVVADNFVDWLNRELDTRGWSHREAGRRSGLSGTTISDVIAGKTKPGWQFCASMATALGARPEDLLRLAGLLPPLPPQSTTHRQLADAIKELSEGDAHLILRIVRGLLREGDEYSQSLREQWREKRPSEEVPG